MDKRFSIVVPIYNEAESIEHCIKVLDTYLHSSKFVETVIFVNDGSTDDSLNILKQLLEGKNAFKLISFNKNQGLSTALKTGFDAANTPWVAYLDADLQTRPKDFDQLIEFAEEYDFITGIRQDRQDGYLKRLSSKFANAFRQLFTDDGISDTGCPLKLIKTDLAQKLIVYKGMHRFLPALAQMHDAKIKAVAVKHFPRTTGNSKFNMLNRSIGPLIDCFVFLWMRRRFIKSKP